MSEDKYQVGSDDYQVGGDHYISMCIQPWDALNEWLTEDQFKGFLLGSAISYLARYNADAPGKGGRNDISKAKHYLEKLLELHMTRD